MRLRYDTSVPADAKPLVLTGPGDSRVEIHVRVEPDKSATLLAFGGHEQIPDKTVQQGPYQLLDQAIAAKRAIVAQLKDAGFVLAPQAQPLWSLHAQRSINDQRTQKLASAGNYHFDPKDVFLDW